MNKSELDNFYPDGGKILISDPFIQDKIFSRSVIYLIDSSDEGCIGLILNKVFPLNLNDLIQDLNSTQAVPLFRGGPVAGDSILFIHTLPFIEKSKNLGNGLYLNGDFKQIQEYISNGGDVKRNIRFFLGYSGWKRSQLVKEIKENSWVVADGDAKLIMMEDVQRMWEKLMFRMGGKYKEWALYPILPSFN